MYAYILVLFIFKVIKIIFLLYNTLKSIIMTFNMRDVFKPFHLLSRIVRSKKHKNQFNSSNLISFFFVIY